MIKPWIKTVALSIASVAMFSITSPTDAQTRTKWSYVSDETEAEEVTDDGGEYAEPPADDADQKPKQSPSASDRTESAKDHGKQAPSVRDDMGLEHEGADAYSEPSEFSYDCQQDEACGCDEESECCESWADGFTLFPEEGYCGWKISGHLDVGVSTNSRDPVNPGGGVGNLPLSFVQRNEELVLNQFYVVAERATDTGGCGWDVGGRLDFLFGEDYIWTQAVGLETRPNGVNHWNQDADANGVLGTAKNGLAMPQAYAEIAFNRLKLKLGHFYTPIGYEVVMSTGNFFYSHALTHQWGEPFTHTGGLATWEVNDQWALSGGVVNGWDKFDAVIDRSSFLGGATWKSSDEKTSLAFGLITGDEDGAFGFIFGNRTMYSLVATRQITDDWQYVFEHDNGTQENGAVDGNGDLRRADWYSLTHYLFYTFNDKWRVGARYEWFNDQQGVRIFPNNLTAPLGAFAGHFHDISLGANWTPHPNVVVRPEIRWDWFDPHDTAGIPGGAGPYTAGDDFFSERSLFLASIDAIVKF